LYYKNPLARIFFFVSTCQRVAILFLGFLVLGVFALGVAKFAQLKLALHCMRFVGDVIYLFAARALQLHIGFLFCGHVSN
jgi:hypothetical protein